MEHNSTDLVIRALCEIAEESTVYLTIETVGEHDDPRCVRVAFRAPVFEPRPGHDTFPLFDPVAGEAELAGYGPDVAVALSDLRRVLAPYFAPNLPPRL